MVGIPSGTRVWSVAGHTDTRKGFDDLAEPVQTAMAKHPFEGQFWSYAGGAATSSRC